MPDSQAGLRIDPPVSVPKAPGTRPAATAAAEPLDDPPVKYAVFQGLRAGGHGKSNDGPPCANSWVASLPISIAPASYSRATAAASCAGTLSIRIFECAVVRMPAVSYRSFNPNGTPCSGPR